MANKKVDINLSKLGKTFVAQDGKTYLEVDELVKKFGYTSDKTGDVHITIDVMQRMSPSQYGDTHSVKGYNRLTKTPEYINCITVRDLVFPGANNATSQSATSNNNVGQKDTLPF